MHKEVEKWAHDLQDNFSFKELREEFPEVGRNKARGILNGLVASGSVRVLHSQGRWGQEYLRVRGWMRFQN